jgi:hypothetical protein
MTSKSEFGKLEKVNLREHWAKEDTEFTPWLSDQDNLRFLGESIGMELELVETETHVGPFRADILCREINSEAYVLIENQLEQTDHLHLGQLMTYAAGLDAVYIIWIAQAFNDEHRAALDWLNHITTEGFYFFGIEVELWKIGNSLPAPKFNIVSKPNEWTKAIRTKQQASKSQRAAMYFDLWNQLVEYMRPKFPNLEYPNPIGMHWIRFPMMDSRAVISYAPTKKKLSLYVLFRGDDPMGWFQHVKGDSKAFQEEIGHILEWVIEDDGSGHAKWFTDFNHEEGQEIISTFEIVGDLINNLKKALTSRYERYVQQEG